MDGQRAGVQAGAAFWGPPPDLASAPDGFGRCWHCRALYTIRPNSSNRYCDRICREAYFVAQSRRQGRCLRCRWYAGHGPNCRTGIAERDNWTCQLCFTPVDPELVADHPLSASFDHATPKVHGGPNTETNLRLTHRVCNNLRDAPNPGEIELSPETYVALVRAAASSGLFGSAPPER
jgi:hypothetical protein